MPNRLQFCLTACLVLCMHLALAGASVDYRVYNAPGRSTARIYHAVRSAIIDAFVHKRDQSLKNSTSLDRSWEDAVLLKFAHEQALSETNDASLSANAGIEIVCTQCYIKGKATAELQMDGDPGQLIQTTLGSLQEEVQNFTQEIGDYFVDYAGGVITKFDDGIDFEDFDLPTFNYSFEMDIPPIPECTLRFQFDDMELYMMMNTIISAGVTYELSLYRSNSPLGISITKDLELGVIFAVDLILSVEGEIDISSGFHIKLDDGAGIDIALFADDISDITFNGGQCEFLPVTLESASVVLSAVLRIGVHAGFALATPDIPEFTLVDTLVDLPSIGGGIEVGVFANVAEFITNVTLAPEEDCQLQVVQSYQLALGAVAGATIAIDSHTWGPVASTSVPIWYTELGDICAAQKTAAPMPEVTAAPPQRKRQDDVETITTSTEVTYTGVSCLSTGLANCPASLQSTHRSVEMKTIVTTLPSGADFTFPVSVRDDTVSTIAFGKKAISVPPTSGSPVSYVPPPPSTSTGDGGLIEDVLGSDRDASGSNRGLIIGLACGLGIPFVIALCAAVVFIHRRKKRHTSPRPEAAVLMSESAATPQVMQGYINHKRDKPTVSVAQVQSPGL